ncbi:MAG: hypothetical protein HQ567_02210 [Candidatus Nealsonbacteria bacterium]|nr:hypothetical protein [Candidatus Nealsonbacteria bacterium]
MTRDELRAIMEFLMDKVHLKDAKPSGEVAVAFDVPSPDEMAAAALNGEGCRQILDAPWWDEMVEDIVETPEMCEEEDPPEQVLQYARDVVSEYIRKRAEI